MKTPPSDRRTFLKTGAGIVGGVALLSAKSFAAPPKLRVIGIELLPVRATERTVWLFVRLRTDTGLFGLGEASDAFGFTNTTAENARTMESELRTSFVWSKASRHSRSKDTVSWEYQGHAVDSSPQPRSAP